MIAMFKQIHFRAQVQLNTAKILIISKNASNKSCSELNFVQKSQVPVVSKNIDIFDNIDIVLLQKTADVDKSSLLNLAAKLVLICLATSVPSEATSSAAGYTVMNLRSKFLPKNLSSALFLNRNYKILFIRYRY